MIMSMFLDVEWDKVGWDKETLKWFAYSLMVLGHNMVWSGREWRSICHNKPQEEEKSGQKEQERLRKSSIFQMWECEKMLFVFA